MIKESKYFLIWGYWKDNKEAFGPRLVKDTAYDGDEDDDIFQYDMSESVIKNAILAGKDSEFDFVITYVEGVDD